MDITVVILSHQVNSPLYGTFQLGYNNREPSLFNERVDTLGLGPTTLY